MDTSFA